MFQFATLPKYKNIWKGILRNVEHDPEILSSNHSLHLLKARTERFVHIADVTSIQTEMAVACGLTMLDLRFMPLHYSVAFQNNTAYKPMVNDA